MGGLSAREGLPRRLSKPQTQTSSILSPLDHEADAASPPMPSSRQDYFDDYVTVISSQGERRSRRKSRSRIRAYLYGADSEVAQTPSDNEDGQNGLVSAARDVRKRLSRTGSSIMQLQSAKTSTARLSDSSSSRLQLSGSQSSDAEESAMLADQIKERAYKDSIAAQNHVTQPVDEDKHVDSVMAPVRRKSLYTPGLATRNPSDILKKPPQPGIVDSSLDRDYYYNPSKPLESPLSQLAALQLRGGGRETPSNMNYAQLGGIELGTLRVTNGTASPIPRDPTPKLLSHPLTPESKNHDDYYTASEGSVPGDYTAVISSRSGSPLRFESRPESSSPMQDSDISTPCGSSPSRNPDTAASLAHNYILEFDNSSYSHLDAAGVEIGNASTEDVSMFVPQAEGPAAEMWRNFINDAEVRHGGNETQEDALRQLNGDVTPDSESIHLRRPSTSNTMSSRYSAPVEITQTDSAYSFNNFLGPLQTTTQSSGAYPTFRTVSPEADSKPARDSPAGSYSSVSRQDRRSRSVSGAGEMFVPAQGRYSLQESGPPPLVQRRETATKETVSAQASFTRARKLQKPRPRSQPPLPKVTVQGCRDITEAHIPRVPSIIASKHAERLRQFPLLDHTFPSSNHTNVNDPVSPTDPSNTVLPVPIRFPSPANALEAATVGSFAELNRLERPQKSRSRASSKHRRSTIVQTSEEEWPASGIVRSPSWSDFGRGRKFKEQKRVAKQEREVEKRLAKEEKELEKRLEKSRKDFEKQTKKEERRKSARSRSASKGRSSDPSCQGETPAIVADFGTVAESLGGNPYDIATAMLPSSKSSHTSGSRHPHQISTAMSRPKSVVGMADLKIVEAARPRMQAGSRSFGDPKLPAEERRGSCDSNRNNRRPQTMFAYVPPVPAVAAINLKRRDPDWASSPQRNSSIVEASSTDAPPVPSLPSAEQAHQREAQITRFRPHSISIDASPPSSSFIAAKALDDSVPDTADLNTAQPEILVTSHRLTSRKTVPALWMGGSLERRAPKSEENRAAVETDNDRFSIDEETVVEEHDLWETQRQAWRQRRKSAGEALLRNQITGIFENNIATSKPSLPQETASRPSAPARAFTTDLHGVIEQRNLAPNRTASSSDKMLSHHESTKPQQFFEASTAGHSPASQRTNTDPHSYVQRHQTLRPGPNPPTQRPAAPRAHPQVHNEAPVHSHEQDRHPHRTSSSFAIPRKRVGSGASTPTPSKSIERLSGRYDGGLLYGYEPGWGLGGSAGTRGARTEASRKSVDVSRGFGLDLSDVPIFVAPTAATTTVAR